MKRSTVTDVARLAKVGTSSVSRFLRGVSVRPDAAARIAAAVEQLGYTPDETARALRGARTHTIGLVVPQVANGFFSHAIELMEQETRRRGWSILLMTHGEDRHQQLRNMATLARYRVDGLILAAAPHSASPEIAKALPGVPIVTFDRFISSEFDSVALRNREAARAATEHLLWHRYKSVACVSVRSGVRTFAERISGYYDAMEAASRPVRLIEAADYDQLRAAIVSSLGSRPRPAALLSLSNMVTRSILAAYNDLGESKGERPPFIGFDDFDLAALVTPSVTVMIRWAQNGGWVRPAAAPMPFGFSPAVRDRRRERTEARWEAHGRMTQAERSLDTLEGAERADGAAIDAALRALAGVRTALRRRPLVAGL